MVNPVLNHDWIIINPQNSILDIHSSWITHDKSTIFHGFSPAPEIAAAFTAQRVPGLVVLQAEPGRLDAFPGRLVEGAHHAGLDGGGGFGGAPGPAGRFPLVPLVPLVPVELPLGKWMGNLWGFGTLLLVHFCWGIGRCSHILSKSGHFRGWIIHLKSSIYWIYWRWT